MKIAKIKRIEIKLHLSALIMKKMSQFPIITENETGKNTLMKLTKIEKRPILHLLVVQDKIITGFIGRREDELVSTLNSLLRHLTRILLIFNMKSIYKNYSFC